MGRAGAQNNFEIKDDEVQGSDTDPEALNITPAFHRVGSCACASVEAAAVLQKEREEGVKMVSREDAVNLICSNRRPVTQKPFAARVLA